MLSVRTSLSHFNKEKNRHKVNGNEIFDYKKRNWKFFVSS